VRRARNLEQVDDTGDGCRQRTIVDTLKTAGAASTRASVRAKDSPENVMSGGPGEPGPRG
jgi:hypothetical protein